MIGRASLLAMQVIVFATMTSLAEEPKKDPGDDQAERKRLIGVWKGYVVDGKGGKTNRGPVKLELTITEKAIRGIEIKQDGTGGTTDHGSGEYSFDLSGDPRCLDAWQKRPNGQKSNHLGIYKLDGDTLYWCVTKGKNRPTEFATGRGGFLVVVKREPKK